MTGVSTDDTGPTRTERDGTDDGSPPGGECDQQQADGPAFEIPDRPERRYTRGGVKYVGGVAFHLEPGPGLSARELDDLLGEVFERDRYVPCDWFDFPRPVYLVHDRQVSTAFRVVARTGRLELHALPSTDPVGLRSLYDEVTAATDGQWSVRRVIDPGT